MTLGGRKIRRNFSRKKPSGYYQRLHEEVLNERCEGPPPRTRQCPTGSVGSMHDAKGEETCTTVVPSRPATIVEGIARIIRLAGRWGSKRQQTTDNSRTSTTKVVVEAGVISNTVGYTVRVYTICSARYQGIGGICCEPVFVFTSPNILYERKGKIQTQQGREVL